MDDLELFLRGANTCSYWLEAGVRFLCCSSGATLNRNGNNAQTRVFKLKRVKLLCNVEHRREYNKLCLNDSTHVHTSNINRKQR